MEQHPVPQNILEVEFKLFGSFTLKQFSKILFGCLAALIAFFLPLPEIIKFTIMGIAVLTGIALAIIPNLGTWISGYLKALFISPRYVWKKQTVTPDILKETAKKQVVNRQQVAKAQNQRKVDLSEISLNELFGTRGASRNTSIKQVLQDDRNDPVLAKDAPRETNLDRLYNQLYSRIQEKKAKQQSAVSSQPTAIQSQDPERTTQNAQQSSSQPALSAASQPVTSSKLETPEDYQNEINRLKKELQNLVKDQNYKEKESDILNQINELYQHLKFSQKDNTKATQTVTNQQGQRLGKGQHVLGIVVDKQDQPLTNSQILFKDLATDTVVSVMSSAEGKFTTQEPLYEGDYEVSLVHPSQKFHSYKIHVGNQPLPAYKFRAK